MKTSMIAASAMLAAIAVPVIAQAGPAAVPNFQAEKCYGIAKAGLNDCQTATHSCAGTSTSISRLVVLSLVSVGLTIAFQVVCTSSAESNSLRSVRLP